MKYFNNKPDQGKCEKHAKWSFTEIIEHKDGMNIDCRQNMTHLKKTFCLQGKTQTRLYSYI